MHDTPATHDVEWIEIGPAGRLLNNADIPLAVYRGVLPRDGDTADYCEKLFKRHRWRSIWRNGIYNYHHFHTLAHEVLGIARGDVKVAFGGPDGVVVELHAGDVVVIPAGVSHKNDGASADLVVVGAYPVELDPDGDLHTGTVSEAAQVAHDLARVKLPATDPVYGADGPLLRRWRQAG